MAGYRDVTMYGPVSAEGELACTVAPSNAPNQIDRIEVLAYSMLRSELNVHHSNNCIDFQYGATRIPAFSVKESSSSYDDNNLPRYVVGDSGLGISLVAAGLPSGIAVVKTDGAYTAATTFGSHPATFDVDAASVVVAEPYTYLYEVDMLIAPDVSAICAALANATVYWDAAAAAATATVLTPEPRNAKKYTVSVALLDLLPNHGVRHVVRVEYTLTSDDALVESWSHAPVSLQTLQSRSALPKSGEFLYLQRRAYTLAIALTFDTGETLRVENVDALCTGTVVVPPWVQPNWPVFGIGDDYTVARNNTDAANALIGHLVLKNGLVDGGRLQLAPAETGFVAQSAVTKYYQVKALRVSAAFIDLLRSELGLLAPTPYAASDTRAADEAYQMAGTEARGMGMAPDRVYHLAQLAYDYVGSLPTEVRWDAVRVKAWRVIREDPSRLSAYAAYYTPDASNAAFTLDASPIALPYTFPPGSFDFLRAATPQLVNFRFKPDLTRVLESRFAESTTPLLFMKAVREAYSAARGRAVDDDLPELSLVAAGGGEFRHSRPFVVVHVDRLATLLSLDARTVFDKTPDTRAPYASSKRAAGAAEAHVLSLPSSRSFAQTAYEVLERYNRNATKQRSFILKPRVANIVTATLRVGPYATADLLCAEAERAMNAAVDALPLPNKHPVVVRVGATPYIEVECATNVTLLFGTGASVLRSAHRLLGFRTADTSAAASSAVRAPFPYDLGDDPKMLRVTVYVNGTEAAPMYHETRDEQECTFLMYIGALPSILQTQSDPCCTSAVLRMSDYGSKVVHMQQTLQKIDRIALRFAVHLPSSSSSSTGDAPLYNFRNQNVLVVLRLWEVAEAGKRADSYNRSIFVTQQRA